MPGDPSETWNSSRDIEYSIFKRRRLRASRSCYPCRRRKVKCSLGKPCDSCDQRGYPDLCDYAATASSNISETIRGDQRHRPGTEAPVTVLDKATGVYVDPLMPYTSKLHLGPDSLPRLLNAYQRLNPDQSHHEQLLPLANSNSNTQTIFEVLCLQDSSASFPFTNLWKPDDGPEVVYRALPEAEMVTSLFRFCKASLFRILPHIIDFRDFEANLSSFLSERGNLPPDSLPTAPQSCTSNWFGILFGILACGVQLSTEGNGSDMMKARVFACCSFQCLRLSNFISFPTIEVIQALILLVNFLMNQADAGAAWSMLGLAIRLAQSLGLHYAPHPDTIGDAGEKHKVTVQYYVWRALIGQDTLLSLCYDRPSGITVFDDIATLPQDIPDNEYRFSFADSCHHLFVAANKISQALNRANFSKKQMPLEVVLDFKGILNRIEFQSAPHIQDVSKCQNRDDCIQHYFFRVFSDSVMLCLCRPGVLSQDQDYGKNLADIYLSRSHSVLRTYLELLKLDCPVRRSWLFVHISLSCALSLGITVKDSGDTRDRASLRRFVDTLSGTTICANVAAYEIALGHLQKLVGGFAP